MIPKAERCECEFCETLRREKEEQERPAFLPNTEVFFCCVNASLGGAHCKIAGFVSACNFCMGVSLND